MGRHLERNFLQSKLSDDSGGVPVPNVCQKPIFSCYAVAKSGRENYARVYAA